jgi:CheY-like chemotaxis protein
MLGRLLDPSFRLAGRNLLLVDAPSEARSRLAAALRNEGADVTVSNSAWGALVALQLEAFSAVVTRLELCPRDGFWLLARARAEAEAFPESATLPFVALSNSTANEARALRAGFASFHQAGDAPESLIESLEAVAPPSAPLAALARDASARADRGQPGA